MKKLLLLLTTAVLLSCGTDQGEETTYTYKVINKSGKPIQIESYFSFAPDLPPVVTNLLDGEAKTDIYEDGLPPSEYNYKVFFGQNRRRDSIVIIYANEKQQSFTRTGCAGSERNPLNTCIYHKSQETFIFTEEDHERATLCEDGCR